MIRLTNVVMYYAPIGVFGLISYTVSKHGLAVLLPLGKLILASFIATALFCIIVYGFLGMEQVAARYKDRRCSCSEPPRFLSARRFEGYRDVLHSARQHDQHERYGHLHGRLRCVRC